MDEQGKGKTLDDILPKKGVPENCRMLIVGSASYCPTAQTSCPHIGMPADYFAQGCYECRKWIRQGQ